MSQLSINVLGQPHIEIDGESVHFSRRKSLALLVYLAVTGEPQQRETLATLLWPEATQSKARGALRRELFSLRKVLDDEWLQTSGNQVNLGPSEQVRLDMADFVQATKSQDLDDWVQAVEFYRDDFLSGFTLPDSPEYDDWQFFEAEELRSLFSGLLQRIIAAHGASAAEAALPFARRWQALDLLHEPAHQQLMLLYAQAGQQAAALRQYQLCVQVLEEELDVPPSEETTALYERIRGGEIEGGFPAPTSLTPDTDRQRHIDWGEAPDVTFFYGRGVESTTLARWLTEDRCRLITVLGMGGLGKTALVTHVAGQVQDSFDYVVWRSLRNAPPPEQLLSDWILVLSDQQHYELPSDIDQQITLLLDLLSRKRCLLVLDNVESIHEPGGQVGQFRPGYEGYGRLLQRLGEGRHESSLILTSREKPSAVAVMEGEAGPARSLQLPRLSSNACRAILHDKELVGSDAHWTALNRAYSGNPLALKLVAQTIRELFDGEIEEFLTEEALIFGGIQTVLAEQVDRLTPLEKEIMAWLAIEREPVDAKDLLGRFVHSPSRRHLLEALRSLYRRSLVERSELGFSQQSVVMEYVIDRLVEAICLGIMDGPLTFDSDLNRYALMLAQTKEYVRESQRRLLLLPVANRLLQKFGRAGLRNHLEARLAELRRTVSGEPGYAGGNLLNLVLPADLALAGLDFSGLAVWQANLQGVELQDISLAGADLSGSVFTDTIGNVASIAISPDGKLLAAGESTGNVRIWRVSDGQLLTVCEGHKSWVFCVRFSPDGCTVVSSGDDSAVRLWDVHTGKMLALFEGHSSGIWALTVSPDGQMLASSDDDGNIRLWDISNIGAVDATPATPLRQASKRLWLDNVPVRAIAFSSDGSLLAAGDFSGQILLWHREALHTGDPAPPHASVHAHDRSIWTLAFSPNGNILASGAEDNLIHLWDVASIGTDRPPPLLTLEGHTSWVRSAHFSPDGRLVATASEDKTVRLWAVDEFLNAKADNSATEAIEPEKKPLAILVGHTNKVGTLSFNADGTLLASGSDDQSIRLWGIQSGVAEHGATTTINVRFLRSIQGYSDRIWSAAFSPDGRSLSSGHASGFVHLWNIDLDSPEQVRAKTKPSLSMHDHNSEVITVCFSPNGQVLASGSWDRTVRLWDAHTGQLLKTLSGHSGEVWSICFSPDGRTLASGSDQLIHLWDVESGKCRETLTGHKGKILSLDFTPGSALLASAGSHRSVRLWDVSSGYELRVIPMDEGARPFLSFSPDGQQLAVARQGSTIELLNLDTGQTHLVMTGHDGVIWSLDHSHGGRLLASGATDRLVHLWDTESGKLLATLEDHTNVVQSVSFSPDDRFLATAGGDETIRLWDVEAALAGSEDSCVNILRVDRPYERTDITGVTGITEAQKSALRTLGAVSRSYSD